MPRTRAPPAPVAAEVAAHLARCPDCASAAEGLAAAGARVGRSAAGPGWGGAAPPEVDVEAALAAVLAAGGRARARRVVRVTRLAAALRAGALGAAAALVLGLAGPTLIRARLEAAVPDPQQPVSVVAAIPPVSSGGTLVLWTP